MSVLLLVLGVINVLFWGLVGLQFLFKVRGIAILKNTEFPVERDTLPKVSVVIAARNEQKAIERCVESLFAQTYPNLEVVMVNDRSTDNTGLLLQNLQAQHPSLQVLDITELPDGWLGKSHALCLGTRHSTGEWLLFSDADILFHPTAIEKGVSYSLHHQLDHLTLIPEFSGPHLLSRLYSTFIFLVATAFGMLWKVKEPGSKQSFGVGAFNLLTRSAYEQVGTHEEIRMCTTDDAKLGEIIKKGGFRQDVAFGREMVEVWNWYETNGQLVRSVEKSVFRIPQALLVTCSTLLTTIFPFVGVFVGTSVSKVLCGIAVLSVLLMYGVFSRYFKNGMWYGITAPLIGVVLIVGALRGAISASINGGMSWRNTVYDRKNLKA